MENIWILGEGIAPVDKQFICDCQRMNMKLNNKPFPNEKRSGLKRLMEECNDFYFIYSKYMNQTLGNMIVESLLPLTSDHIIPLKMQLSQAG